MLNILHNSYLRFLFHRITTEHWFITSTYHKRKRNLTILVYSTGHVRTLIRNVSKIYYFTNGFCRNIFPNTYIMKIKLSFSIIQNIVLDIISKYTAMGLN